MKYILSLFLYAVMMMNSQNHTLKQKNDKRTNIRETYGTGISR